MNMSSLKFLTSGAKWKKVSLLIKEQRLIAQYVLKRVLNGNSTGAAAGKRQCNVPQMQSAHHSWCYSAALSMPVQVVQGAIERYRQDQILADGSLCADFDYQTSVYHEALFYSNGTSHVSVFDANRSRLDTFSSVKYKLGTPGTCRLEPQRRLSGTTVSVYGNVEHASGNIGHWIVDGISRLFLVLKHHEMADIDYLLVPTLCYDFQRDSLHSLGFTDQQIIEVDALECVQCERLILTTAPRGYSSGITPGWLIDGFRQSLLPAKATITAGKRIYISRRDAGSRKFVDEEAIIACLEGYGFEAVEMSDYSFNEKIALFANAEIIIGLTGAGLTNAMLCQTDAVLIELLPQSYVMYFYASMCCYLGLNYHCIVFASNSLMSNINKFYGELHLEPQVIADKLDEILNSSGQSTH